MSTEKIKVKDMTEFEGPVDTGDAQAKRPRDKKGVGDKNPDESVSKTSKVTDIAEEVKSLFAGVEGLSEDFADRAAIIFEGAVSERESVLREQLEAEYAQKLDEAVELQLEEIEDHLDSYLKLVVENFLSENKIALEQGFKSELAEAVIESVKTITEAAGIELPEEKIDIAESLAEDNKELEQKYNALFEAHLELSKKHEKLLIAEEFRKRTAGLTEASKDKLNRLVENMEFDSVEDFNKKFDVLKESFINKNVAEPVSKVGLTEATEEKEVVDTIDPRMKSYLAAARSSIL